MRRGFIFYTYDHYLHYYINFSIKSSSKKQEKNCNGNECDDDDDNQRLSRKKFNRLVEFEINEGVGDEKMKKIVIITRKTHINIITLRRNKKLEIIRERHA